MPLVIEPCSATCRAERLARAATSPDRPVVGPSGAAQGMRPDADSGEEMALDIAEQFLGFDVGDRALVDYAGRDGAGRDQVAQPRRGYRVDLVVEDRPEIRVDHGVLSYAAGLRTGWLGSTAATPDPRQPEHGPISS